jgi:hypothetical protein
VLRLYLADGRAVITLGDRAGQGFRSDEVLAFGQIVCTMTSLPEVGTVSFVADGAPLWVPRRTARWPARRWPSRITAACSIDGLLP